MATNTRIVRELRNKLSLNSTQKSVLVGSILGDGSIIGNMGEKICNINYRFQTEQSAQQKKYVWWKYNVFQEWVLAKPRYMVKNHAWRFRTISHPEFTEMRKLFYDGEGKKRIPANIDELLKDPLLLAVWFMDDGAKMKNHGYVLNSQNFSDEDNLRLKKCLEQSFGFKISLHKDKTRLRLYIRKDSLKKFNETVKSFILPCMRYKLLLTP